MSAEDVVAKGGVGKQGEKGKLSKLTSRSALSGIMKQELALNVAADCTVVTMVKLMLAKDLSALFIFGQTFEAGFDMRNASKFSPPG
jgi:hypothetical protein